MGRFADAMARMGEPAQPKPGRFGEALRRMDAAEETPAEPQAYVDPTTGQTQSFRPGVMPNEAQLPPGRVDVKRGSWAPKTRTRAVFTDRPGQGYTSEELGAVHDDWKTQGRAAFLGGAVQGATFGFGDEAAALIDAAGDRGDSSFWQTYRKKRDEYRDADKTAREMDPGLYMLGQVAGSVPSVVGPGAAAKAIGVGRKLGMTAKAWEAWKAAHPVVTGMGRGAAAGAVQGFGSSNSDLTQGTAGVGQAVADTAEGAALGAGTSLALSGAGKLVKLAAGAPERVLKRADDALIDAASLGAPAGQRDSLLGERGELREKWLEYVKGNKTLEKALRARKSGQALAAVEADIASNETAESATVGALGERQANPLIESVQRYRDSIAGNPASEVQTQVGRLDKLLKDMRKQWMPDVEAQELASLNRMIPLQEKLAAEGTGPVAIQPHLDRLEKLRAQYAANPSPASQAMAKKVEDAMANMREMWMPAAAPQPEALPEGKALTKLITEKAPRKTVEKVALKAEDYNKLAKEIGLDKLPRDTEARASAVNAAVDAEGERIGGFYTKADAKKPAYLSQFTAPLDKLASKYENSAIPQIRAQGQAMRALEQGILDEYGRIPNGLEPGTGKVNKFWRISAVEASKLISEIQRNAFRGPTLDATTAQKLARDTAQELREAINTHVRLTLGEKEGAELVEANKRYGMLKDLQSAAKRQMIAARRTPEEIAPVVGPETRTGTATVPAVRQLAADLPEAERAAINETLQGQMDPAHARRLAEMERRQQELMAAEVEPATGPDPRTGTAPAAELRKTIKATTDDETREALASGFRSQLSDAQAQALAEIDARADLLQRTKTPLAAKAARESTPPTTLRHHTGEFVGRVGHGGLAAGAAATVAGHPEAGLAIAGGALTTLYGRKIAAAADQVLGAVTEAVRIGASKPAVAAIVRKSKLPAELAARILEAVLPKTAAGVAVGAKERQ